MKTLFKYISSIFFSICLVLFFIVLMLFARELKDVPDITQANLQDPLSSEIYDKNLNLIATVGAEKREYVSINDIPKNITEAVLTTEDSRFQSHIGIDPIRLIKAVLVNIRSNSAQQGASTITQQVVKNSLLTSDKSLQRKIQEAYLSLKLENRYTKDDIMEMYMNKIYYSDGQYGVKTAAKYFYNKELDQLTLPQVALLTGMPQQPILYNPYDYPKQAKERRDTVLYALLSNNKITEDEYNNAVNTPITDGIIEKTKEERANQHSYNPKFAAYIDQITKELKENQNFENIKDPLSMGLKIYTNLNPELQIYVQDMLDNQSAPMRRHASQAAISVLDTKTGLVEAIGGGKNYKAGGYNYAVDARVQPGSSIKPLIDYAPGIEYYGWDSQTTFSDTPYQIAGTNFYIQNWDRLYHGTVPMSRALAWSYNIPAVRAFETVGYERAKHFAEKLDIPVTKDEPTTAIGGNVDGVSTLQMAGAFASFGNKGYFNKPSTIVKVFNANGKEFPNIKAEPIKAMSEETAYLMTNVLKGVLTSNGLAPNGKVANFDMAGKSGSSTFDDSAYYNYGIDVVNSTKDSWMIGYTTDYTVAVWQGADIVDSAAKALSAEQAKTTQVIMADVMKKVSDKQVPATFEKPAGIETKNGVEYAKERNTETDYMYAGTDRDAVYQAAIAQKQRENRSPLTTVFNSLTNSTQSNRTQNQANSRTGTGNTNRTAGATNQNTRR